MAAIIKEKKDTGNSILYNAYTDFRNSADCSTQTTNLAIVMSKLLNY